MLNVKNADTTGYMLTSSAYLQKYIFQKFKKSMELANIVKKKLNIFLTTRRISMTFSGKTCLMIILKM